MSYKMDYRSLKDMRDTINADISQWKNALELFDKKVEALVNTNYLSGDGADSIKLYFYTIHIQGLIPAISANIEKYLALFTFYYNDYVTNIDTNEDSAFNQDELTEIRDSLNNLVNRTKDVENNVINFLNRISDIFSCNRRDASDVVGLSERMKRNIETLDSSIISCENNHFSNDFSSFNEQTKSIYSLIAECRSKSRNFKESFTSNSFSQLKSSSAFIASTLKICDEMEKDKDRFSIAYKNVQDHVNSLTELEEKERADRERIATYIKIGVTVITSAALIVATAGAAAPVVVGLVSAGTAVLTTATNGMLDEYVEKGNLDKMNWKNLAIDCAVSGTTGFITAYAGSGIGKTLKEVGPLSKLVKSSSTLKKFAGNVVISSTKNIVTGLANNTVKEAGNFAKTGQFQGKAILGLSSDQELNIANIAKKFGKTVAGSVVDTAIDNKFDSFEKSSKVLHSDNNTKRTIENVIFGSTKETFSGIASRTNDAIFDDEHDFKKILDGKEMAKDAIKGGVEQGYNGAKDDQKEIYKKTYYHTEKNGNRVVMVKKDGTEKYRIDRDKTVYSDAKTPNDIKYDRQYIRDGGKIEADSKGNVTYTDTRKTTYEKNHPIKNALKKNFVTGEAPVRKTTYNSNGEIVSDVTEKKGTVKINSISDVFYDSSEKSQGTEYNFESRFNEYRDSISGLAGGGFR